MASVKQGQHVSFTSKGRDSSGVVQKVWSRGRYVGVNITDDVTGKLVCGVSLHDIEPNAIQDCSNPAHGGSSNHKCYYISIDEFGCYAMDSENDEQLLAVSYVNDPSNAIQMIQKSMVDYRLVGARFET